MRDSQSKGRLGSVDRHRRLKVPILAFFCAAFLYACSGTPESPTAVQKPAEPTQLERMEQATLAADYTSFSHQNPMHERLPCLLCHIREDNSPTPKLSGHLPCAGCHVPQFADQNNKICAICHTDAVPGSLKQFPPLKNFGTKFDHAIHTKQTNCGTCHSPSRRGVALSIPAGSVAHTTCFQCHRPDAEADAKNIGSCSTCHEPGGRELPGSEKAKAFSYSFSHAKHRGSSLNCSSCHSVRAGAPAGRQVSSPTVAMHFASARSQSCGGCHNDKRSFGMGDFSNCKRCHEGKNFKF